MQLSRHALRVTLAIVVGLAVPGRANADVLNGSFEFGVNPPAQGTSRNLPVGNTDITGWLVFANNIDWGTQGFASDGIRALDLNGNQGPGGIQQTITTNPGTAYTVLFDMNANTSSSDDVSLQASAGSVTQSFTYSPAAMPTLPWVTKSLSFVATNTTTLLSFLSTTTASLYFGPGLDNVVLVVPEPRSTALFACASLVAIRLRRRRKAR